jgi:SAM-dependent methyltransferase
VDDQTAKYYEENAESAASAWEQAHGAESYFGIAFPAGARVLDIGSGSGRDLARLMRNGWESYGLEPSSALREQSVRLHPELMGRISAGALPANVPTDDRFDGILCSGVLQHLPKPQLFDAVYAIRELLKPRGRVLVSIPGERSDVDVKGRDAHGRLFNSIVPGELALLFERTGYQCIGRWTDPDQLGRGFNWTTILFELRSKGVTKPLDMVEAVLNRDKKVATYKLALFRALCDIALTQTHSVKWHEDGRVAVPMDSVADRWVIYYWPLFDTVRFLPQMNGEWRAKQHGLAFKSELGAIITAYEQLGGLSAFACDRRRGTIPEVAINLWRSLRRKLKDVIRSGPVTHAGGSLDTGPIFEYQKGHILIAGPLWSELCLMGHWIQDALLIRWAELISRFSKGSVRPDVAIAQLLVSPDPDRETDAAREIFANTLNKECVWSGRGLGQRFVIDHVLPFSLWRNNDLWNLLPADAKVNGQKSDRLPTRRLLHSRRDAIFACWDTSLSAMSERFQSEAKAQTGSSELRLPELFDVLVESVEVTALQRGCERWEP